MYVLGIEIIGSESGAGGITLELDVQWDGNPNIVLDVKTRVGVALPIQVLTDFFLQLKKESRTKEMNLYCS